MKTDSWYEDDSFWGIFAPLLFTEQRFFNAPQEIDAVVSLVGVQPDAHILDLCCGVGRHSLELARRGFRVVGVDRTETYLDRARKEAKNEGLEIEFVQEDMRRFCRPSTFDGVINLFTSFGYFEDPEDDRRVIENVFRSLQEGGFFIMDLMGKEILAERFQERDWSWIGGEEEGIFLEERKISKNWSWIENRWILLKGGKRKEFFISHRLYSACELSTMLSECGFDPVDVYGDFTGTPYDHVAKRLIVVGRK